MHYSVRHRTTYRYEHPVSISHHVLRLMPRQCPQQRLHGSDLVLRPAATVGSQGVDYFGNPVTYATIQQQHLELVIEALSSVEVNVPPVRPAQHTPPWEAVFGQLERAGTREALDTLQYAFDSPYTLASADLAGYAGRSFTPGRNVLEAAQELTRRIHQDFRYDSSATTVSTPVDEVVRLGRGVCQDFAHLELACLRSLGVPGRYVSGYLLTRPPPGQQKLVGADASHAWVSVWCGEAGWVDFDPTNDTIVGDEHVTLAWGRDYGDVSPINGVIFGGGAHRIEVNVDVTPVPDTAGEERIPG
jgi:transglutaminase-like putative cysteine protease